jgi:hypothetical protein
MKRFLFLFMAVLMTAGTAKAGDYVVYQPSSPVTVDWNEGGNQPSYSGSYFTVSKNDIIKVHVTNVSSSNYDPKLVWKGSAGGDWYNLNVVSTTDGLFTYTIPSDEIATSINKYGVALSGIGYKMLDICVQTNNVSSTSKSFISGASTDLGQWNTEVSLSNYDFSSVSIGDVINLTWTSYNIELSGDTWATIQIQGSENDKITEACSVGTQISNLQTTSEITIDNEILSELRSGTAKIKGGNVYLNALSISSDNLVRQQILSSDETYFGNWHGSFTVNATQANPLQVGDVLNVAYEVPEGYSDGAIVLREASGEWTTITDVTSLTGTGTAHFYVTESLLSQFQNGINITGYGGGGTDNTNGVKWTSISFTHFVKSPGYRPVYIPASGYGTFFGASTCALPDNVTAYYVSEVSESTAKLTSVSNIPANEGVILNGPTGIYQLNTTSDEAASVSNNKLSGSVTRQQITETTNKYVLYDNNGTPEFRKITADSYLDAYKCYLDANAGARLSIVFNDDDSETAGVLDVKKHTTQSDNVYYNLRGMQVDKPTKGLYIMNGKKVIVK